MMPKPVFNEWDDDFDRFCKMEGWANELEARVVGLEQAFRHYASHDEGCIELKFWKDTKCNCGYREVLETLNPE